MEEKKTKRISTRWIIRIGAIVLALAIAAIGGGVVAKYVKQKAISGTIVIKADFGGVGVLEHEPTLSNGQYMISRVPAEVSAFTYKSLPGVSGECDAFVRVAGKTEIEAWLVIEVVNATENVSLSVDSANWKACTEATDSDVQSMTPANGGVLYYLSNSSGEPVVLAKGNGGIATNGSCDIPVLSPESLDFGPGLNAAEDNKNITVYAYLIQKITSLDCDYAYAVLDIEPNIVIDDGTPAKPLCATGSCVNTFELMTASIGTEVGTNNSAAINVPARDFPVFIRAFYTVNWVNAAGQVYGTPLVEGVDYTIDMVDNFGTNWFTDANGFCYYKNAVGVNQASIDLIDSVTAITPAPEGYTLKVEIAAQYIQAIGYLNSDTSIVTAAWNVVYNGDDLIIMPTP